MGPDKDDSLSALGEAEARLYAKEEIPHVTETLSPARPSLLPLSWKVPTLSSVGTPRHVNFAKRFFLGGLAFFLVSAGVAALLFFTGTNTISVANVSVATQGPTTIAGGDIVPLSISMTNKNPVAIQNVQLEVDFPEGTRSAEDVTKEYPHYAEKIGTLAPGQTVERSVKAILFGQEGQQLSIPISVSYGTGSSNAIFVKKSAYPLTVSTAPLSVAVNSVSETVSGQTFVITATVRSNATSPISGVILNAQYPNGYALTSSSVTPVGVNFPLGTINPGDSKTVSLTGILTGQNADARVFHFTVGTAKSANDPSLAVSYMSQEAEVAITAPFLATSITVDGSSANTPVVAPGRTVSISVRYTNTLSVPVTSAQIAVALTGSAFDPAAVQAQNGFYNSSNATVIFGPDTDPALGSIAPGASGQGNFTLKILPNAARNSSITLTLSIQGGRQGQSNVPEQVTASAVKTIKVASAVTVGVMTQHVGAPFSNSGPVPPVANQGTSYGITFSVLNGGNDLANAVVTTTLPPYVTYTGMTSSGGAFTYDSVARKVTWNLGDLSGGAKTQASFQILLTPSTSQKGTVPPLTSAPVLTGFDRFASANITAEGNAPTTETKSDPGYVPAFAVVQ